MICCVPIKDEGFSFCIFFLYYIPQPFSIERFRCHYLYNKCRAAYHFEYGSGLQSTPWTRTRTAITINQQPNMTALNYSIISRLLYFCFRSAAHIWPFEAVWITGVWATRNTCGAAPNVIMCMKSQICKYEPIHPLNKNSNVHNRHYR